MDAELARLTYNLGKDARDWKVELAQNDLKESGLKRKKIVPILYRPFDLRYTYYTGKSRGFHCRPRPEVMRHMMQENLGLITRRQMLSGRPCNYVFVSNLIVSDGVIRSDNKGGESLFPLYLYSDTENSPNPARGTNKTLMIVFEPAEAYRKKKPNINQALIELLTETYKEKPSPEQIFYYIYAVLYSNTYRSKYADFLKIDFPRVPFTKNHKWFLKFGEYGRRLVDLHLLKSPGPGPTVVKFHGKGTNKVEELKYEQKEKRLYINPIQHFEGISKQVWQYQIGGYQVCHKWLKDRKGRRLSLDDLKHYCKIATALGKTIVIQKDIDAIYSEVEEKTIEF